VGFRFLCSRIDTFPLVVVLLITLEMSRSAEVEGEPHTSSAVLLYSLCERIGRPPVLFVNMLHDDVPLNIFDCYRSNVKLGSHIW
jgi:hypothetical protein